MIDDMEEIWVLYADDGAQSLDTAEQALRDICSGIPEAMAEGVSSLFRAVHTFKGNARVLGLRVAESRAHVTEDLIGLIRDQGAPWDDEMASILQLAIDRLRVILEQTAAQRADINADFGADVMQALSEKIAKVTRGGQQTAQDVPAAQPAAAGQEEQKHPIAEAPPPSAPDMRPAPLAREDQATSLMAEVIGPLRHLAGLRAQPETAPERAQILRNIAGHAEALGFERLADIALSLASSPDQGDTSGDVRLYEELNTIELALPKGVLPHPRPQDLFQGWCAENAFAMIDAARSQVDLLAQGIDLEERLKVIESLLRRVSQACTYHGLRQAAELAMTLLDVLVRIPSQDASTEGWLDQPIFQMLRSYLGAVELAIDSVSEGEEPNLHALETLSERSGRYVYDRSGTLTALDALEQLHLPVEFLRVMSPRSVNVAQCAVQEGRDFWVARTDFENVTDAAEKFFSILQDGAIQQITSVSILSAATVQFDFLLATSLGSDAFSARIAEIDPSGQLIRVERVKDVGAPPKALRDNGSDMSAGVSVEMMEMLGEVSAGLSRVAMHLGDLLRADEKSGNLSLPDTHVRQPDTAEALGAVHQIIARCAGLSGGMEESVQALETLARQVSTLQEDAMASRLRPAEAALAPMVEDLRKALRAKAPMVKLFFTVDDIPLDRQTLHLLDKICETYVLGRLEGVGKDVAKVAISLRQRDDRAILSVTDDLPLPVASTVLSNLKQMAAGSGGRIWAQEVGEAKHGFVISLPRRTLAMEGMVVQAGGAHYVMPVDTVVMVLKADAGCIVRRAAAGTSRFLRLDSGEVLPIVTLNTGNADKGGIFVIVQAAGRRKALLVDELLGQQVVRLRPLQGVMEQLDNLAGFAVLAGGQIALVLSPLAICHDNDLSSMAFEDA